MAKFVEARQVQPVPPGTGTTVEAAGKEIAIFNVDGIVYAVDDSCAHAGASVGSGKLDEKIVTRRAHDLRYGVTTGQVTTGGFRVASFPAKIEDGEILIVVD